MNEKIRIGYLMHGLSFGGAPWSLYLLLQSLPRERFSLYLYTINAKSKEVSDAFLKVVDSFCMMKSIKTISINQVYEQTNSSFFLRKMKGNKQFLSKIEEDAIDILHINTSVFPNVVAQVKRRNKRIKVITHIRELIPNINISSIAKYMVDNIMLSDVVIAISDNEAGQFLHHKNLHVLPNPFDFNQVCLPTNLRRKMGISPRTIIVTMLGQFHKTKGHLVFIEALKKIVTKEGRDTNIKFMIVGYKKKNKLWKRIIKNIFFDGDYGHKVFSMIEKYELQEDLLLHPFTTNVYELIQVSDIIVRPAITADPWGRDIIEAMAHSKPVVATGNSSFYIENEKNGFLVPPNRADLLAEKILLLSKNEKLRERMGELGFNKVHRMCNLCSYADSIIKIYESLENE